MIPQVVQVFHLYPEACEDLFRYAITGELADVGKNGVTIQLEERRTTKKHYKARQTVSFDVDEAKELYRCLGLLLAQFETSKEALVQVEASEASSS